jgi:hypothetical protein
LSSRWGTTRAGATGGFSVWFELDLGAPAAGELSATGPAEPSVAADG